MRGSDSPGPVVRIIGDEELPDGISWALVLVDAQGVALITETAFRERAELILAECRALADTA